MIHRTYQVRGYVSGAGYAAIDRVLAECAALYNAALQERRDAYRQSGKSITYIDQAKEMTHIRRDDPYWGGLSLQVARGTLRRVDRAMQAFYRRCKSGEIPGYPRFRSRHRYKTLEMGEVNQSMVRGSRIRIKGLPTIRLRRSLPAGVPVGMSMTRSGRRLTVSLTYAQDCEPQAHTGASAGIDMGVIDRLTLSTGESYSRADERMDADIKRKQQRLSRCKLRSRRWKERKRILARAHEKKRIRNRNTCHRITTDLVRRFDTIAVENLKIRNMTRSAAGTLETPGRNVAAKSGLNRSILDQSWGVILWQLAYKAEWAGKSVVAVPPHHTSQTCSRCGTVDAASRSGKQFTCTVCGYDCDADVNAARNILTLAGGDNPPPSTKRRQNYTITMTSERYNPQSQVSLEAAAEFPRRSIQCGHNP